MKTNYISILILLITLFTSCSNDDDIATTDLTASEPGAINLTFDSQVAGEPFTLDQTYTINGESITINQLRYWVSNIVLINEAGEAVALPESYFLIEETGTISIQDGAYEYPATQRESIALSGIPAGEYTDIQFSIGIDSQYNDNLSLQAGELSQLNGMTNISWMWHTSYIFASVKGMLNNATELTLETGLNSSYRTLTIPFSEAISVNGSTNNTVTIASEITGMLEGIDFAETPIIGASTPEAMTVMADNFQNTTFTLQSDSNE